MKNKKKSYLIIAITLVVIIALGAGVKYYLNKKENSYKENLSKTYDKIAVNATLDSSVNRYYGTISENALKNRRSFGEEIKKISAKEYKNINDAVNCSKDGDDGITEIMKKLKDPPKKYKEEYEKINNVYDAYSRNHARTKKVGDTKYYGLDDLKTFCDDYSIVSEGIQKFKKIVE